MIVKSQKNIILTVVKTSYPAFQWSLHFQVFQLKFYLHLFSPSCPASFMHLVHSNDESREIYAMICSSLYPRKVVKNSRRRLVRKRARGQISEGYQLIQSQTNESASYRRTGLTMFNFNNFWSRQTYSKYRHKVFITRDVLINLSPFSLLPMILNCRCDKLLYTKH
jgi:hypothetical protein